MNEIDKLIGELFGDWFVGTEGNRSATQLANYQKLLLVVKLSMDLEREECVKVCNDYINTFKSKRYSASYMESYPERFAAGLCAEAIRKRGDK